MCGAQVRVICAPAGSSSVRVMQGCICCSTQLPNLRGTELATHVAFVPPPLSSAICFTPRQAIDSFKISLCDVDVRRPSALKTRG